ncbi:MAG TPA: hypothetical protein VGX91_00930 [Candidatus Cybelea sp.]|jgi:hypothetical protein|nr:hypothetical protein [Candidatus Cybelea sp.]
MSSVAKGSARVGAAMSQCADLGFRCARVSASGQRKGFRRDENCLAGDLLAIAPADSGYPHCIVEVGGVGKRLRAAFEELHVGGPLPAGFVAMVGRVVRRRWLWYSAPDERYTSLEELLDALRR